MADQSKERFNILCCVDGSDESYRGIRYAARLGKGNDADITLLYIRPVDQGLRTGGMQISVARANLLEWGLELPGIKFLKKGRDILVDLGVMGDNWEEEFEHTDIAGDPLGDNLIEYTSKEGKTIRLVLMVSPTVSTGILDECDQHHYDVVIMGASERWRTRKTPGFLDETVAQTVAEQAPTSVIVARELEENHGHLICLDDSDRSIMSARRDAVIASRCECPISLLSVAPTEEEVPWAEENIARAKAALDELNVDVAETNIMVGEPVAKICEAGRNYSIVVVPASDKKGFRRFFQTRVAYRVMEEAECSVMIARDLPPVAKQLGATEDD